MTADALTKVIHSACLLQWLTTGTVKSWNTGHSIEMKQLARHEHEPFEEVLVSGDVDVLGERKRSAGYLALAPAASEHLIYFLTLLQSMALSRAFEMNLYQENYDDSSRPS